MEFFKSGREIRDEEKRAIEIGKDLVNDVLDTLNEPSVEDLVTEMRNGNRSVKSLFALIIKLFERKELKKFLNFEEINLGMVISLMILATEEKSIITLLLPKTGCAIIKLFNNEYDLNVFIQKSKLAHCVIEIKEDDVPNVFKAASSGDVNSIRSLTTLETTTKVKLLLATSYPRIARFHKRILLELSNQCLQQRISEVQTEQILKGMKKGTLLKKSDWTKEWKKRVFVLRWNNLKGRSSISYYKNNSQTVDVLESTHIRLTDKHYVEVYNSSKVGLQIFQIRKKLDCGSSETVMSLGTTDDKQFVQWISLLRAATSKKHAQSDVEHQSGLKKLSKQSKIFDSNKVSGSTSSVTIDSPKITAPRVNGVTDVIRDLNTTPEGKLYPNLQVTTQLLVDYQTYLSLDGNGTYALKRYSGHLLFSALLFHAVDFGLSRYELLNWIPTFPVLPPYIYIVCLCISFSMFAIFLFDSSSFSILRRSGYVFYISISFLLDFKVTELRASELPVEHAKSFWRVKQIIWANNLYSAALHLGGVWIKGLQYMGSKPEYFPDSVIAIFSRLQDKVPTTDPEIMKVEVLKTLEPVEKSKGALSSPGAANAVKVFRSVLSKLKGTQLSAPIASGTIGQAHELELDPFGFCIMKIQHPSIVPKVKRDVKNFGQILFVSKFLLDDRVKQFEEMFTNWKKNVLSELNFMDEERNLQEIRRFHMRLPFKSLRIPACYASKENFIILEKVTGVKLTSESVKRLPKDEKWTICDTLFRVFCHHIFILGKFNADPHPGNIFYNLDAKVIYLLDFGMCGTLSADLRIGLMKMIIALVELDLGALAGAKSELGVLLFQEKKMRTNKPVRGKEIDIPVSFMGKNILFLFRDINELSTSREEVKAQIQFSKEHVASQKKHNPPFERIPAQSLAVFRALDLLRGICSMFDIKYPLLKILYEFCKGEINKTKVPMQLVQSSVGRLQEHFANIVQRNLGESKHAFSLSILQKGKCLVDISEKNENKLYPVFTLSQSISELCALDAGVDMGKILSCSINATALPPGAQLFTFMEEQYKHNCMFSSTWEDKTEPTAVMWELSHAAFAWGWRMYSIGGPKAFSCLERKKLYTTLRVESQQEYENMVHRIKAELSLLDVLDGGSLTPREEFSSIKGTNYEFIPSSFAGREYLLEPRMIPNYYEYALCPQLGSNLFTNDASSVNRFSYESIVRNKEKLKTLCRTCKKGAYSEGYVGIRQLNFVKKNSSKKILTGYGQFTLSGSVLLCIPEIDLSVTFIDTILSIDRSLTSQILQEIYSEFGLVPIGEH
eukprot:snap_masked-scaffold_8-processed-gene-9.32-mRNA-1 protein AED:1.00 eAED:1.00 QI:0/0/0/0/1/1/4/0/1294